MEHNSYFYISSHSIVKLLDGTNITNINSLGQTINTFFSVLSQGLTKECIIGEKGDFTLAIKNAILFRIKVPKDKQTAFFHQLYRELINEKINLDYLSYEGETIILKNTRKIKQDELSINFTKAKYINLLNKGK